MAEKGYETGHHAPGLKLHGTGLYKAAHHIIKVKWVLLGGKAGFNVGGISFSVNSACPRSKTELSPLPFSFKTNMFHSTFALSTSLPLGFMWMSCHAVLCWTLQLRQYGGCHLQLRI